MNKNDKKMVIKIYDMEYENVTYIRLNKFDKRIQKKADFFFFDNDLVDEECKESSVEEIASLYNKRFSENITPEQARKALEITDFGECGPTVSKYIDVFKALGFKVDVITTPVDLQINII